MLSQRYALVLIRGCLLQSLQFVRGLAAILAEGYENACRAARRNSIPYALQPQSFQSC